MSRRRFYAPPEAFSSDRTVLLDADEAKHLREVLRLKPGDQVTVFNGAGKEFLCTIESAKRTEVQLKVVEEINPAHPESPLQLTLAVALLKSDKFDLVVQKATELGVSTVIPVMTKLADIKLRDESDADKRVARWRRIALEAAKQSGRAFVPEVMSPVPYVDLMLASLADSVVTGEKHARIMFAERGGESLKQTQEQPQSVVALVGSEGGWTHEELTTAQDTGWQIITLGGRTMRAETAAITVTALLQHLFGDLK